MKASDIKMAAIDGVRGNAKFGPALSQVTQTVMSHVINRPTVQCEFKGTLPHPTYRVNVNVAEPGYEDCLWFLIVTHLYVRIVSVHRSHFDALCSQTQGLRRWCDAL